MTTCELKWEEKDGEGEDHFSSVKACFEFFNKELKDNPNVIRVHFCDENGMSVFILK